MRDNIYAVIAPISVPAILQSAHTLYLTLYIWNRPPSQARAEALLATSLVPHRHAPGVARGIGDPDDRSTWSPGAADPEPGLRVSVPADQDRVCRRPDAIHRADRMPAGDCAAADIAIADVTERDPPEAPVAIEVGEAIARRGGPGVWQCAPRRDGMPSGNVRHVSAARASLPSDTGRRFLARRSTATAGPPVGSCARVMSALPGGVIRSWGYLRKSNGLWPQQRPAGRYHRMPLSSTFDAGRLVARARIGRKMENASASPQVTGSGAGRTKIVKLFEFMPLSSAPSRIRTCAHGSGGRCSIP